MTLRVEHVRRRFDRSAQASLDQARARRIIAEARADLDAAKASRSPQEAELYVLAIQSLTRGVEEPKRVRRPATQPKPTVQQAEIDRVFCRLSGEDAA